MCNEDGYVCVATKANGYYKKGPVGIVLFCFCFCFKFFFFLNENMRICFLPKTIIF